jgi:NADH dehydrogenase FAD-containing subunit
MASRTNRINQPVVRDTLQTTRDEWIFALGDCAACPWQSKEGNMPPRAQAAHHQASFLPKQIRRRVAGEPTPHGPEKVALDALARIITRRTEPHVRLR